MPLPAAWSAAGGVELARSRRSVGDRDVARLGGDALEPRADRRIGLELEPALRGDVRVGVERDVGDRVALADEELALRRDGPPSRERRVAAARLASRSASGGVMPASAQKRATAMFGSWLYCSKNSHWSTWARSKRSSGRYGGALGEVEQ